MNFNLEKIANKLPFFDFLEIDSSWEKEISFLDSHPKKLIDTHPKKLRYYLRNSDQRGSLDPWAKDIINEMKEVFEKNHISLIKFLGFGVSTESYPWHADKMDVFLVQAIGHVMIKVENTLSENYPMPFLPGECVFVPRGTHHQIIPQGSRVTYSFGVEFEPDPSTYIKG